MNKDDFIRNRVELGFKKALSQRGIEVPDKLPSDFVLLDSGLDSLGFAVLVTSLEDSLGYDPFILLEDPIYPRTYSEFEDIYLKFSDHYEDGTT